MVKVLLVYANSFMDNLVPVGVSLLSACLKKAGHETKLFDTTFYRTREQTGDEARVETLQIKETNLEEFGIREKQTDMVDDFKKMVDEFNPDIVAASVVEITYLIGMNLLNSIKDRDILRSIGGIHVTMDPEGVIKEESVDVACVGEGEESMVELADKVQKGEDYSKIPNLWVKKDGDVIKNPVRPLENLDELPDQDWSIYEKERFFKPMGGKVWITGPIELNRGCPFQCDFCCNATLQNLYKEKGKYTRQRSVDKFIEELKKKQEKYGLNYLYLVAENFLQMTDERFDRFIELYKDIKLPFWVQTRPETVNLERIKKLQEVGCEGLSIGVEHGNEEFRKKVLNRFVPNDVIIKAFDIASETGIRMCANNIVGFPTETRELFFDTVELNRKIKVDNSIVNIFCPYRGTRLWELSVEKGYISKDAFAGDYRSDAGLDMPQLNRDTVKGLQRTFPMYVRFPKDMWPEIEKAEKLDEEGNKKFQELKKIYIEKYMS